MKGRSEHRKGANKSFFLCVGFRAATAEVPNAVEADNFVAKWLTSDLHFNFFPAASWRSVKRRVGMLQTVCLPSTQSRSSEAARRKFRRLVSFVFLKTFHPFFGHGVFLTKTFPFCFTSAHHAGRVGICRLLITFHDKSARYTRPRSGKKRSRRQRAISRLLIMFLHNRLLHAGNFLPSKWILFHLTWSP